MDKENPSSGTDRIQEWMAFLGTVVLVAGLGAMAYLGFYNRYWSDDWCYKADFNDLGMGGTLSTYFMTGDEALRGYSNNRYSLTILSWLFHVMGITGAKLTALSIIVAGLLSTSFLVLNLSKLCALSIRHVSLFVAATFLYYTLYLSPQRFQVLYWISGIHYSFAVVSAILMLALITYQMTRRQRSQAVDIVMAPLALFAGGLSEAACSYLIGLILIVLGITWWGNRKKAGWAPRAYPTVWIAFVFLLGSLLLLILSPSNAARVDSLESEPTGVPRMLFLSFRFSFETMLNLIKSQFVPYVVFVITFVSLPVLFARSTAGESFSMAKIGLMIAGTLVIVWVLSSSSYAPSVYFYGTPPDPRGRLLAHFTALAGLAFVSWLLGTAIKNQAQRHVFMTIALLGIVLHTIYTVRSISNVYSEAGGFIHRAQLWDERDADIKAAKAQGETRLEVVVIDMQDVNVRDIMGSSVTDRGWVTTCGSRYYGLEAIRAAPP